jgi:hypothetical protein
VCSLTPPPNTVQIIPQGAPFVKFCVGLYPEKKPAPWIFLLPIELDFVHFN